MRPSRKKRWPWIVVVPAVLAGAGGFMAYDRSASQGGTGCRCRGGQERDDADAGDAGGHPGVHGELARLPRCRRGRDPEGHFCTVRIKVRNIGGTTRTPGISFAQAFDAQSVAYLADAVAEVRADAAGASLLDELKPGAQVTAPLIYDLPATATITSLLLRESPSAPGIKIALS